MVRKTIFIGHPISGDVKGNVKKVLQICAEVHTNGIIPVVPYIVSLQYLNDEVIEDRTLGMEANHECFHRRYVDELWLFAIEFQAACARRFFWRRRRVFP